MDPEIRFVHTLLEQWGRWSYDSTLRAYPPVSLMGRMISDGPAAARIHGKPPLEMPYRVALVDGAVAKLDPPDKRAIVVYYTREEPIEVCAFKCRIKVRQFRNVLSRARWKIALYLPLRDCLQSSKNVQTCSSVL